MAPAAVGGFLFWTTHQAHRQPGPCGPWPCLSGFPTSSAYNPKKKNSFGPIENHSRGLAGPCPKVFSERCMCAWVHMCLIMHVPVCFPFSIGTWWGHTLYQGLPFLSKWRRGVTAGGAFRWACGSLRVCWLRGSVGEAQGLPAPAASASELACLGLPTLI